MLQQRIAALGTQRKQEESTDSNNSRRCTINGSNVNSSSSCFHKFETTLETAFIIISININTKTLFLLIIEGHLQVPCLHMSIRAKLATIPIPRPISAIHTAPLYLLLNRSLAQYCVNNLILLLLVDQPRVEFKQETAR